MAKKPLPKKLSELLRLAVKDAQQLGKTPGFGLRMQTWVREQGGLCEVCMAGAIMVCELDARKLIPFGGSISAYDMPKHQQSALHAVNDLRTGDADMLAPKLNRRLRRQGASESKRVQAITYLAKACGLIHGRYNYNLGRADWDTYLKAADMLQAGGL